ncbi:Pisatin demethylase [Cytospora mali]|uniref:Pisatin demethylase n=1 Tax=Cytospora mali TaxID=578113 RepID=A0A194UZ98_CYTMA|nr:Pisatin demethylase [Valsa mali var. pyri (nom. inval.)]
MAGPLDRIETEGGRTSPTRVLLTGILPALISWWFLIIPGTIIVRALYRKYASPLRKYPGPWLASATRLWKLISAASTHTHLDHIELHKKYGPVVRIGPNEVSLSSPEAARMLLSAGKRFYKTKFYGVFPPPENPDIFTEYREDVHAQKKKVANVPYSMAAMQQLSPFIDDTIELLTQKMDAAAAGRTGAPIRDFSKGPVVDLGNWLHWFAFDVLGEVAFSRSFGFLEQGRDVDGAIHTIDESQRYNGIVGQVPFMDHFLRRNPLWKLIPMLDSRNALITRMAYEELGRRRPFDKQSEGMWTGGDGRRDLLASLIKGHLKDPQRFSEGDVFAVAHGAIFAGSDSTASTMQSFFWHILADKRVYARIQEEMNSAVEDGTIPASGNISWAEAQKLQYFQACLKEAMRVRPAVGLNIVRMVPPEGAELDGQFFPGGVTIAVNGWVLHRDKSTFGEDAEVYRPERWLGDVEEAKRMERYMFQFGGGSHLCIGRNLALLEINKVCPRLLRDFNFELVHPDRELRARATFFVVQEGLEVYISRKQQ